MRNLKLVIEYDGSRFAGWQVQNGCKQRTIQDTLARSIQKILREKVYLTASGRTDAGVHALGQVANFKTRSQIETAKLRLGLNALLPEDISVLSIEEVPAGFHSRFSAKSKLYRYTILNRKSPSPILRDFVYFYHFPLNLKLMRNEAKVLLGRHNFSAFQARDKLERDAVRTIKKIKILKRADLIYIDIEANGFVYNMVRNIAGTLIEIARGRFARGGLKKILLLGDRKLSGPTAPAKGLCLLRVNY